MNLQNCDRKRTPSRDDLLYQKFRTSPAIVKLINTHHRKLLAAYAQAEKVLSKDLNEINQKLKHLKYPWGNLVRICRTRVKEEDKIQRKLYQLVKERLGEDQVAQATSDIVRQLYEEIYDKVGGRICILFLDKVKDMVEHLKIAFGEERKYDLKTKLSDKDYLEGDELGYRGYHFYVYVPLDPKKGCDAGSQLVEVQVRTLCQHAWADVSHDLIYKNMRIPPNEIPRDIKADMKTTSNMLDSVDRYFITIRERVENRVEARRVQ